MNSSSEAMIDVINFVLRRQIIWLDDITNSSRKSVFSPNALNVLKNSSGGLGLWLVKIILLEKSIILHHLSTVYTQSSAQFTIQNVLFSNPVDVKIYHELTYFADNFNLA